MRGAVQIKPRRAANRVHFIRDDITGCYDEGYFRSLIPRARVLRILLLSLLVRRFVMGKGLSTEAVRSCVSYTVRRNKLYWRIVETQRLPFDVSVTYPWQPRRLFRYYILLL